MNPASASVPAPPRVVNDVAGPAPAQQAPAAPNLVANIPVHAPVSAAPAANEDDELDKIMQDVGHEMNSEDKKPHKRGLLHFGHKAKPKTQPPAAAATVQAQPLPMPSPQPALPKQAPVSAAQPQPGARTAAKSTNQRTVPVFAIFVALLVTGFLVAAAVAAYRQS